ncbi:NAD(P)H-hydrate dehydratase [Planococcus salinus]|uniref:ADP-dependent (S)-NAD(P)H-hydrate dehydratase n=1 Tax=Planococcus salinus TaxID=1848460 RepID=A0A3M8PE70_9BACL|nr:NAD(P)H-hydrate dehydratase [Planococcus salinus]RNF41154.1 NAD(P)H-hydrate dehydratase [Planococcus salinus]
MPATDSLAVWTEHDVKETLPVRAASSHKGSHGTGLLIAGSRDMPGAALLAGLGAMRSGIGKLVIDTDPEAIPVICPTLPEATYRRRDWDKTAAGSADLGQYRAIAAGPGIEPTQESERAFQQLITSPLPLVLDAGALLKRSYNKRTAPTILTPHLGEFARLTDRTATDVQENRPHYARMLAGELEATIVLKGHETIIAFPDGESWQNPTGNSALAKGGTGDTLTGMLLGMLCCHDNWKHAVLNAVFLHGACADAWTAEYSAHTLLAHELTNRLPEVWRRFEKNEDSL